MSRFKKLILTRQEWNEDKKAIEEVVDFIGKHTQHKEQSVIYIREPISKEVMDFTRLILDKINGINDEKKRKDYLDMGFYRIDFDDFFLNNAHKYIYLENQTDLLYSSKSELECEENTEMLSVEIINRIKTFFFTSSLCLASWNAKKEEEARNQIRIQAEIYQQTLLEKEQQIS